MDAQNTVKDAEVATERGAFYSALEAALGHPAPRRAGAPADAAPSLPDTATCRFTIVIPALNEEQAIGGTLTDVLEARRRIVEETAVTEVRVVVVNDGSTDRTQEIAERFDEITTIRFEKNRGYGAAIKAGFKADDSELVGFMDADGTLEAESWIPLINKLFEDNADVVLGARLNDQSDMPLVRRLGNWGFARLLGFVSGRPLTDCASGMRVIRRGSLKYLMPLPDGLHFTPAMSCNALLDRRLKISEVPVPYAERVGRSKLNVLKDGMRFLTIILLTGCFYNPIKCAACGIVLSWMAALIAWLAGWEPALLLKTMLNIDVLAAGAALVCHQAVKALIVAGPTGNEAERSLHRWTQPRLLANIGFGLLGLAALVTLALLLTGSPKSGLLGASALAFSFGGVAFVLLGISLRMMQLIRHKFEALIHDPFVRTQQS
ncbi:MAG: glycosyltransferase family 2 protein [Planctomycetes bacterium]|nr:glycosyltransferase family 2 protein [Planctomycetota bacterium]